MRVTDFYFDYGVEIASSSDKHYRPGWVNVECPFCTGNPGHHLGYDVEQDKFFCWRCGWKPADKVVSKLAGVNLHAARALIKEYGGKTYLKTQKKTPNLRSLAFPSGTNTMELPHIKYLERRGFTASRLEKQWGLLGTGPFSSLDGIPYKNRIVAPFYWNGKVVTFQTRDITNKAPQKYLACPIEREIIHHKDILYGRQEKWKETGIIVEGITDVWALGTRAAATLGIQYTTKQVNEIANHFKRVAICFDPEPQAQRQAKKLKAQLKLRGVDAWTEQLDEDPAEMSTKDRIHLIRHIF